MSTAFLASAFIQFALGLVVAWILGPMEFGAYALALAAAVLAQTLVFEWIRLSATRFHHAGEGGQLVGRLGRVLALLAAGMTVLAGALFVLAGPRSGLYALVPLVAISAGFADFRGAVLRAEFDQRGYALFMLFRNLLAITLLPLAADRFGSAEAALLAFLLATMLASAILELALWKTRRDERVSKQASDQPETTALLRYAGPIILTNCLYLALFFAIRTAAVLVGGLAAAGQVSLALDFTLKLFSTLGTALDLVLFQLAVRDSREQGEAAGRVRLRANLSLVLASILPMAVGLALVMPALEPLLVGPEFRGVFGVLVVALLPGIVLYAIVQYALHPFLQLEQRTLRTTGAAFFSLAVGGLAYGGATQFGLALAVSLQIALLAAMIGACVILIRAIDAPIAPAPRFALALGGALAAMTLAVMPLLSLGSGLFPLLAAIAAGAGVYGGTAYALDLAGIRSLLRKPQNDPDRLS